ncbi:MAG: hypothetical protein GF308_19675 [Candidatus Heimdallarchaeota archaeon]|nr:hypothetical protein [Candidatus Heimdallarchaeota archaeon]
MVQKEIDMIKQRFTQMGENGIPILVDVILHNKIEMLRIIALEALLKMETKDLKKIPVSSLEHLLEEEEKEPIKKGILELLKKMNEFSPHSALN